MKVRHLLTEQTSLCHWFPLIEESGVPVPKTFIIPLTERQAKSGEDFFSEHVRRKIINKIRATVMKNGLQWPVFIRTDLCSGKHDYDKSCFVRTPAHLPDCLDEVVCCNRIADLIGLPFKAIVIREFIPLAAEFTAFQGLPIAPERRWFVREGEILCRHPYWPDGSIIRPSVPDWEEKLVKMNVLGSEVSLLDRYALMLSEKMKGFWSLDFALGKNGTWYFIDAGRGELSYHWCGCPNGFSESD